MLYTLNLRNIMCQLHLSKAGGGGRMHGVDLMLNVLVTPTHTKKEEGKEWIIRGDGWVYGIAIMLVSQTYTYLEHMKALINMLYL